MKPRPPLPPGPYLVLGLARSGVAAAAALAARGEQVIAVDSGPAERPALAEAAGRLRALGVEPHLDASGEALAARAGTLVKSPGVPRSAPAVQAALSRGIPVIGELELAWRLLPGEFVAVTGTNGKTTTTEWIGHIHRTAAAPVAVAGNVGTALSSLVDTIDSATTIVAECSSFQLEDTELFAPEAAVLLNLAPDHLDRHGSFEAYVAAKLRIFARQSNDDIAVAPTDLGIEDLGGCARRVCFGGPGAELSDHAGHLWWDERALIAHENIALPGAHNRQNAMAAAAACRARGLAAEDVVEGLRTFRGVAHRLEAVATQDGVAYVNDSKATNVASTLVALAAFPAGSVHLILGGQGKNQDFAPLAGPVRERCRVVYLIGEDAPAIAADLDLGPAGPPLIQSGTLERAVTAARACAQAGETVLLSPACASFDQFTDFEARGEAFRALVTGSGDGH
jgi:UDP-N-acetylmuramoylalanine--D-glutamate ligase